MHIPVVTLVPPKRAAWPRRCSSWIAGFLPRRNCALRKTRLLLVAIAMVLGVFGLQAQDARGEIVRRAKSKVPAVYPELARKLNIVGTVKVEVTVSPNGTVKDAKVVGGHPVLANAALEAVKKWRFEPTALESSGIVDFKFEPRN
jgi:TonB family protein